MIIILKKEIELQVSKHDSGANNSGRYQILSLKIQKLVVLLASSDKYILHCQDLFDSIDRYLFDN